MPEIGWIGSHMQRSGLVYHCALSLGESFLHQQVLRPGWIQHLHAIGIWPAEVLVKSPRERSVAQVNHPYFSHRLEGFPSKRPINFHIDHDGYRPIVGRRNVNELMRSSRDWRGFEVEGAGKVDR